jgi:hypothetical protein
MRIPLNEMNSYCFRNRLFSERERERNTYYFLFSLKLFKKKKKPTLHGGAGGACTPMEHLGVAATTPKHCRGWPSHPLVKNVFLFFIII